MPTDPATGSLRRLVAAQAERNPQAIAIAAPGRAPLSYGRLHRQVGDVVAALNALGVGRNDRVAMVLPDGPELAVAFITVSSGATCAPLNPAYSASEFDLQLAQLGCRALLVPPASTSPAVAVARTRGIPILELVPMASAEAGLFTLRRGAPGANSAPANTDPLGVTGGFASPDDVALALHTSGTGARPKLVPLTHRNICASADQISAALELTEADRCLSVMPLFHIHGLSAIVASCAAGGSVVCAGRFDARDFFEWMETFHPTWYTAAPTIHQEILENARHHPGAIARSTLRVVRSASAAMPRPILADMERVFRVPFLEAYGMTEAAPQIASNRLQPGQRKPGSVGRAAGPDVAVFNDRGGPQPPGEEGEIVIRGANVMSAYVNAEANGSAFLQGWFRTGDTGYLDEDGYLFITGRLKEIINRGGEKISPLEVEEALVDHPAVAEAVVFPVPHPTLGEDVAAAIVLRPGIGLDSPNLRPRVRLIQHIRQHAVTRLAHYKVPQRIVIIDEIPKGPAGKVQRLAMAGRLDLLSPGHRPTEFSAPGTAVERQVATIWASLLRVEGPGLNDNFFESGGDSLRGAQLLSRLNRDFQIELPPLSLFERPTVAELSELVARHLAEPGSDGATPSPAQSISARDLTVPCPLSLAQQRLWLLDQIDPGNPAYNMHLALRLTGRLREDILETSIGEVLRRHEALRTTIQMVGGQPVQVIAPVQPLRLPVVNLTRLQVSDRRTEALRLASEESGRPFHLAHGPLFRASLLKLDTEEHVLLMTMHHIVSDGWSVGVLYRELDALYGAISGDQPSPLPNLPIQYGDFAAWQRQSLQNAATLLSQLAYWKGQLEGMPPMLELPADRPRPAVQSHQGASYWAPIPGELIEKLRTLGQREGATPFMTLLAGFQTLLHRYTGQTDIVVGTPIANRTCPESEDLIGFFANTLVIRADLSGNPTFREALGRVRTTAMEAYANQELPFERLVEELRPQRDQSQSPLFQVMFVFQNLPGQGPPERWSDLTVSPMEVDRRTAKFDLTLYLSETERGLTATWQYNTDLFDGDRIARMAGHFQTLLEGMVATPDASLSQLPLLGDAERRQLQALSNQSEVPYRRDRCFHQLFEEQVETTPDAIAVRCGAEQDTYAELNKRANRLAWRLQEMGVGPETPVGILLTRSIGMAAAVLAVMKAGGAYVPLDPEYPAEHLAFMLNDARVAILVTEERLLPVVKLAGAGGAKLVCLDSESAIGGSECEDNPVSGASPANLAYLIYTSGSTGKPKGVMVTHANLSHYVQAIRPVLGIGADDCYLHTASFAFSSSVRQLAVPLSCGASMVIAPTEAIRNPAALFGLIKLEGVSIVDIVPSYWRICQQVLAGLEPASRTDLLTNRLRLMLSASEPLLTDVARDWRAAFGNRVRLVNMFGQTETAGIVTVYQVSSLDGDAASIVPVGRPIANTQAYVLDAAGQPVPIGAWGELFIGGAGVGRGYLNEPALTAERFVPDPFGRLPGARLYRTGDLTRFLPNGDLAFSGRVDDQIKLRGYRIEPGQVEAAIGRHPGCRESAVVVQADATGERHLVAYVVPNSDLGRSTRDLRKFLKQRLPDYMVPSRVVPVGALPRTPNGKLDRAALGTQLDGPHAPGADADHSAGPRTHSDAPPEEDGGHLSHRGRAEEILVQVWTQILAVDRVGLDDNFFDLGGNSILAIQMILRANQAGLALSLKQLFKNQTIADLARAAVSSPLSAPVSDQAQVSHARVRVTQESLRAYGREALERAGLDPEGAAIVTEVQLEASLRDQPTHNMVSIPRYARRIASGIINPRPNIQIERKSDVSAQIDGDNGPGQWVAVVAMEAAIQMAGENGVGVVGVRRSNHLGAAGHYPWLAARKGLIGLCTTTGPVILAPTGGVTPTLGNNPLGVGIPSGHYHPIMLDIAMSVAPRGKIGLQLAEGMALPPGWILDRHGRPSTDPADLVAGLAVPIGGHKGYGLALIMEVLAGVLTGAGFGWDNRRAHGPRAEKPANFGHFFMAIDPQLFMPTSDFTARVDRMIEQAKAGERAEGVPEILVPGESELRAREASLRDGVPLRPSTYDSLVKYAGNAGLHTKLVVVS